MKKSPARHPRKPATRVLVPTRKQHCFYGHGLPGIELEKLSGKLVVVEGADGSGRSSQIAWLVDWLEGRGARLGRARSGAVATALEASGVGLEICLVLLLLVFCAAWLAGGTYNPFIYFRF